MRHQVKKIRFNFGKDANKMLMRKLAVNFMTRGILQTTLSKAKVLRPYLEKLVTKMKTSSEANKNILLRYLGDVKTVEMGFRVIGPALSKVNGGYIRIIKTNLRNDDGATMAKVEWAYPVVLETKKSEVKKQVPVKGKS